MKKFIPFLLLGAAGIGTYFYIKKKKASKKVRPTFLVTPNTVPEATPIKTTPSGQQVYNIDFLKP